MSGLCWLPLHLLLLLLNVVIAASSSSRGLTRFLPPSTPSPYPLPHQWEECRGWLCGGMFSGSRMGGWGKGFGRVGCVGGSTLTQIPASPPPSPPSPTPAPLHPRHAAFKDSAICSTQESQPTAAAAGWPGCCARVPPSSVARQIFLPCLPLRTTAAGVFLLQVLRRGLDHLARRLWQSCSDTAMKEISL